MRRRLAALALALALIPAQGCGALLDREYSAQKPHEQFSGAEEADALRAESYQGLVSVILYLLEEGAQSGLVRLYNYTGDAQRDVEQACAEVLAEDPLGAYALEGFTCTCTRIVGYYQAEMAFTYRRSAEQIAAVVEVTGTAALERAVRAALARRAEELVVRISYFSRDEAFLQDVVRAQWERIMQAELTAQGAAQSGPAQRAPVVPAAPNVTVALYPDAGTQRIAELIFDYETPEAPPPEEFPPEVPGMGAEGTPGESGTASTEQGAPAQAAQSGAKS